VLDNRLLLHSIPRIEKVFNEEYGVSHQHVIVVMDANHQFHVVDLLPVFTFKSFEIISKEELKARKKDLVSQSCLIIQINSVPKGYQADFPYYISFYSSHCFERNVIGNYIPAVQQTDKGFEFIEPLSVSVSEFN